MITIMGRQCYMNNKKRVCHSGTEKTEYPLTAVLMYKAIKLTSNGPQSMTNFGHRIMPDLFPEQHSKKLSQSLE